MEKLCVNCGVIIKNCKSNRRLCTYCQRAGQTERAKIRRAERKNQALQSNALPPAPLKTKNLADAVKRVEQYNRCCELTGEKKLSYGKYVAKFGL